MNLKKFQIIISICVFSIPNIYFFFINDSPFLSKFLLLFLSIIIAFLLLFLLKIKRFNILNLILTPIATIELFSLNNYRDFSSFQFINSFFLSNKEEAKEILFAYSTYLLFFILLLLLCVYIFIKFNQKTINSKKKVVILLIIFSLVYLKSHISSSIKISRLDYKYQKSIFFHANNNFHNKLKQTYPFNFFQNLAYIYDFKRKFNTYNKKIKNISFNAYSKSDKNEIYVLIIGESSRKHNFSLYGYLKKTTPNLDTLSSLITFKNAISTSNNTAISFPHILTRATPLDDKIKFEEPTLIVPFKESGYDTYWISNQVTNNETIYKLYSNQADEVYNREGIMKNDTFFDENVISKFKEIIHNKSTKKKLIIIHLYGSHYNYNNKYPLEFKKFKPTLSEKSQIEYTKRDQLINSYDNSILYTDFVLSKLIKILKDKNKYSFLFYLSDHGENLYDDKDKYVFHSYPVPKKYELEIPFFIWTSQKYNLSNNKKIKALITNSSKKISTTYLFETIIDMANIKYPLQDFSKSLSSKKFNSSNKRYILTVENKLIQYDK